MVNLHCCNVQLLTPSCYHGTLHYALQSSFALDGEILAGEFPKRQAAFVKAWALLHEDDLKANWTLAVNGEETFRIDPLK